MRDLTELNITHAVQERFAQTPDPRLKAILTSLVEHLHAFVREVEPGFDEWLYAVQFLTRTGQISTGSRQEFILLSDTLGVSMLVDAMNHRLPQGATESTVLGPFFVEGAPEFALGGDLAAGEAGQPLYVDARIRSAAGEPIAGATVDIWQSDMDGFYDVQRQGSEGHSLRGRLYADAQGGLRFWSILPTAYPIPNDGPVGEMLAATRNHPWRPAHLHFMIAAPGYETLVTHIFVEGDQYLDSDAVFGVKQSLIDAFPEQPAGVGPEGRTLSEPWRLLRYDFGLSPAKA